LLNMFAIKVASLRTAYQAGDGLPDLSVWIKPMVVVANKSATDDTLGYNSTTVSLMGGADLKVNRLFNLGLATGFVSTKAVVAASDGSNDESLAWLFMPYCSIANDKQFLDLMYSYSHSNIVTTRIVSYGSVLMKTYAKYPYNSHILNFIYGYNFHVTPDFTFIPKLAFKYNLLQKNSYQEKGDVANLNVTIKPPKHLYEFGLGLNILQKPSELAEYNLRTEFSLMGFWSPGNRKIVSTGQFIAGGSAFDYVTSLSRISLRAGLSMTCEVAPGVDLQAKYAFRFAKKYTEHTASLELRYLF